VKEKVLTSSVEQLRCEAFNDDPLRVARVAFKMRSPEELDAASALFEALGHPVRVAILEAISYEPLCVCELSVLLGMSSPALMHHLRIMGREGIIAAKKEGKFAVYHIVEPKAKRILDVVLDKADLVGKRG